MASRRPPKGKPAEPDPADDEPTEQELAAFVRSMGLPAGIPVLCAVEDPSEDRRLAIMEARARLPQLQTWMAFVASHLNAVSSSEHTRLMPEVDDDVKSALNLALLGALHLIRHTAAVELRLLGAREPRDALREDARHGQDAAEPRADGTQLGDPGGRRKPGRVPKGRKAPRPE